MRNLHKNSREPPRGCGVETSRIRERSGDRVESSCFFGLRVNANDHVAREISRPFYLARKPYSRTSTPCTMNTRETYRATPRDRATIERIVDNRPTPISGIGETREPREIADETFLFIRLSIGVRISTVHEPLKRMKSIPHANTPTHRCRTILRGSTIVESVSRSRACKSSSYVSNNLIPRDTIRRSRHCFTYTSHIHTHTYTHTHIVAFISSILIETIDSYRAGESFEHIGGIARNYIYSRAYLLFVYWYRIRRKLRRVGVNFALNPNQYL